MMADRTVNTIFILILGGCLLHSGAQDDSFGDLPQDGAITPVDPYVLEGETLVLNCSLQPSYNGIGDVHQMTFKHAKYGREPPRSVTKVLSSDTIQLVWTHVTMDQSGYVNCYMGDHWLAGTDVNIGGPQKMECVTDTYSMTCNWCPDWETRNLNWTLRWTRKGSEETFECTVYPNQSKRCSCHLCGMSDTTPGCSGNMELYMLEVYNMTVTTQTLVERNGTFVAFNQSFIVETNDSIVKPAPVRYLKTTEVNSTSLQVNFSPPEMFSVSIIPVVYQLTVYSSNAWDDPIIVNLPNEKDEPVTHTLTGLHPATTYQVIVRCKPSKGGYWSENETTDGTTQESAPSSGPRMVDGSFRADCKSDGCEVTIRWKKIPEFEQNGDIKGFHVNITNDRTGVVELQETLPSTQYEYTTTENLHKMTSYTVHLVAFNNAGASPVSVLHIKMSLEIIPTVTAEINSNSTLVNLWWIPVVGVDNYTGFYCTADSTRQKCRDGDTKEFVVDGNTTHMSLPYKEEFVYSMAASAGERSSGMTHWLCLFYFDGQLPDVDFTIKSETSDSLTINIPELNSCEGDSRSGRVRQYNITTQCTQSYGCSQDASTEIVSADALTHLTHIVEGLNPYTNYSVTVVAVGNVHQTSDSKTSRTQQAAPDSPPLNMSVQTECRWLFAQYNAPPLEDWNGPSLTYKITIESSDGEKITKETSELALNVTNEIYGYTNYTVSVTAATGAGTSKPSPSEYISTSICEPQQIKQPTVDFRNHSTVTMDWSEPDHYNGPLQQWLIRAVHGSQVTNWTQTADKTNGTFTMTCPTGLKESLTVEYSVKAVTFDPETNQQYHGEWSPAETKQMCTPVEPPDLGLIFGVAGGVCFAAIVVLMAVYYHFKRDDINGWVKKGNPVLPSKNADLESISTDPSYTSDWLQNMCDKTPLIQRIEEEDRYDSDPGLGSEIDIRTSGGQSSGFGGSENDFNNSREQNLGSNHSLARGESSGSDRSENNSGSNYTRAHDVDTIDSGIVNKVYTADSPPQSHIEGQSEGKTASSGFHSESNIRQLSSESGLGGDAGSSDTIGSSYVEGNAKMEKDEPPAEQSFKISDVFLALAHDADSGGTNDSTYVDSKKTLTLDDPCDEPCDDPCDEKRITETIDEGLSPPVCADKVCDTCHQKHSLSIQCQDETVVLISRHNSMNSSSSDETIALDSSEVQGMCDSRAVSTKC